MSFAPPNSPTPLTHVSFRLNGWDIDIASSDANFTRTMGAAWMQAITQHLMGPVAAGTLPQQPLVSVPVREVPANGTMPPPSISEASPQALLATPSHEVSQPSDLPDDAPKTAISASSTHTESIPVFRVPTAPAPDRFTSAPTPSLFSPAQPEPLPPVFSAPTTPAAATSADAFEHLMAEKLAEIATPDRSTLPTSFPEGVIPQPQMPAATVPEPPSDSVHINSLNQLYQFYTPNSPQEQLLLAAFYLTRAEAVPRFSLRRLNGAMSDAQKPAVNHAVLAALVESNWLNLVPDVTGMADVAEYALTQTGEALSLKLLGQL